MSRRRTVVVVLGALLLLFSVIASAQPRFPGPRGMHPGLLEKLELSDKQMDQVKKLFSGLERKRIELKADLELKKLELREAMDNEKPNEGQVRKLVREMGSIKTDLHMTRIDQHLGLKKILTPEQQKKLRGLRMMGGEKVIKKRIERKFGRTEPGEKGAPGPEKP